MEFFVGQKCFFTNLDHKNTIWHFKLFKIKQITRKLEEKLRKIRVQIRVCNEVIYTKTYVKSSTWEFLLGKALKVWWKKLLNKPKLK